MRITKSLKPLSFLWIGSLAGSGSTFLIYMILARELGPENFGSFSSAMAITLIFSLISGFGIPQLWLRLFGEEGFKALRWVGPSLTYVTLTFLCVVLLMLIIVCLQPTEISLNQLLLLLLGHISGYVNIQLVSTKLQLEERFTRLAFWQVLPNLLRLLIVSIAAYVLKIDISLIGVGMVYFVIGIIYTSISVKDLQLFKTGRVKLIGHQTNNHNINLDRPNISEVIRQAWPFGMAGLFAFVYMQSDIIMLKYLYGESEAGYYNVAFNVVSAVLSFPIVLFSKYLIPKYHRWSNQNFNRFYEVYKKGNFLMIMSGFIITILIISFSHYFIPLLFGSIYSASIVMTNLLSLSIPLTFLAYSLGATLLTGDHMKLKVKIMGIIAVFNIIINFILIEPFGAIGAIYSTIASNFFLVLLYRHYSKTKVFKNHLK